MLLDEERRAFKRLPVSCQVIFKQPGEQQSRAGTGMNLSGNGILFTTDRSIPIGTELEINVQPTMRSFSPLRAIVKIVRIEPTRNQYVLAGAIQRVIN